MNESLRGARRHLTTVFMGMFLVLVAGGACAAPGDLDFTFGQGGRAFINIDENVETATSLVQQSDGKLLIGRGTNYTVATEVDLSVVRLNPDGTVDRSFGSGGMASVELSGITASTIAVVQQPSGKIIVAGHAWRDDNQDRSFSAVARYLPDGTLDTTFGSGGVVLEDFGSQHASIEALVALPDGRVLAAGSAKTPGGDDAAFTRFNPDGSIDATFASGGRLIVDLTGAGRNDYVYDLVRRADGRLIAAGTANTIWGVSSAIVLALTADGVVESAFGSNGRALPAVATGSMKRLAVGLQSNGKIVLAGLVEGRMIATDCVLVVTRMQENGQPDPSFESDRALPFLRCGAVDMVVASDDRIVIGSESKFTDLACSGCWDYGEPAAGSAPSNLEVVRFAANGSPDASFGVDGKAIIDLGGEILSNFRPEFGTRLVQQNDGRIVIAATGNYDNEYSILEGESFHHPGIVIARILDNGASPGLIGFKESPWNVSESKSTVTLLVQRTGGAAGAVSVQFATSDDSAHGGSDYVSSSGTLTWIDGDMTDKTVAVAILEDAVAEGNESFAVTLSSPTGGAHLATSRSGVVIQSSDPVPPSPPAAASPPPSSSISGGASGGGGGALDWMSVALLLMLIGFRISLAIYWQAHSRTNA